jgi:hypothetical protein
MDGKAVVTAGAEDALLIGEINPRARDAAALTYPYRADRRPELYGLLNSKSD